MTAANTNRPAPASRWVKQGACWYIHGQGVIYRVRHVRLRTHGHSHWAVSRATNADCYGAWRRVDSLLTMARAKHNARMYLYRELGYDS